ncbi:branched-chain-amino-acid aminotransferase-like protein 1 [Camellia sinensis]|uniref:branched-chain-amino-acid aminotransferase-like protein 1 n=1 Tax=Camellia sinensis TaxID=4442 RepID=UPI0010367856|nr:branched-chain-amino-acid aminotransferase-like protein 1 [Camellia sinensis]
MVGFSKIICGSANPKISFYWLHAESVSHFHMLICCAGTDSLSNYITSQTCSHFSSLQHISKQRVPGLSDDLIKNGKHFILIRNPLSILPSFDKVVPPSFLELGLGELVSIYSELCELGKPPAVIDASELQENPEVPRSF